MLLALCYFVCVAYFLFIFLPQSPHHPQGTSRVLGRLPRAVLRRRGLARICVFARAQPFLLTTPRATPRSQPCSRSVSVHFHALARRPLSPPHIGTELGERWGKEEREQVRKGRRCLTVQPTFQASASAPPPPRPLRLRGRRRGAWAPKNLAITAGGGSSPLKYTENNLPSQAHL